MKLIADYHIHLNDRKLKNIKSSVEEITRKANSIGLHEIVIVCHGLKHFYACSKDKFFYARKIIDEINLVMDTNIMLGLEADILSSDGDLDVDDEMIEKADVLLIGYHKFIKTDFASYFGRQKQTKYAIDLATEAYINAIKKHNVDVVVHPNHVIKLDLFKLGAFCAENNVLIELNNKHINFSSDDADALIKSECLFVISSDSYNLQDIGRFDNSMIFIEKYNIPLERVLNLDFLDSEKDALSVEIEEDYKRLQKVRAKYENKYEISKETEDKLNQIMSEKGIKNSNKTYDFKELLSDEARAIVERAEKIIASGKKN